LASELDPPVSAGGELDDPERLDAFLRRWLSLPLFAGIPAGDAGLAQRRTNTPAGLASSLRLAGTGAQRPLWDRLPTIQIPVLVITGERDAKFTALGQRMARAIGDNAAHVVVPNIGHAAHLEDPPTAAALVRAHQRGGPS
jgi:2-succinyl-6-hydroxy-2,4-cyclohexadiene-1-carboxylate synthase